MSRAVLTLLLLTAPAWADPPKLVLAPEVKAAGDYATLTPETDAVSVLYVGQSGVEPFPSQFLKDARAFVLPVRGLAAGKYTFVAVAASKTGEQASGTFAVVVGDPPVPPPGPGPPPQPASPLAAALQPLYATDAMPAEAKRQYAATLAAFYRAAAGQVTTNTNIETLGQLYSALTIALQGKLPPGTFGPLFKVINAYLAEQLGTQTSTVMTSEYRAKCAAAFNTAAAAVESLK